MKIRDLGQNIDYQTAFNEMEAFTNERDEEQVDELWLLEHPPVYTSGVRSRNEDIPQNGIPVIESNRGGLVTYHGPGQLVGYVLVDLKRLGIGIKDLVSSTEDILLNVLSEFDINAERIEGAPGLYVDGAKIAALGYRVRKGRSYHGFSLNIDMDLTPYQDINACGLGLSSTMMREYFGHVSIQEVKAKLIEEWLAWHKRFRD